MVVVVEKKYTYRYSSTTLIRIKIFGCFGSYEVHTLFLVFECQESRVIKKNEPKRVLLSGGGGGGGGVASTALSVFLFIFNKIKNIYKKKVSSINHCLHF